MVTGDYFGALGIALRRGRLLAPEDREGSPHAAVVNEALVRQAFPGQDPIGRRITFGDGLEDPDWMEIVGVVADVRHDGLTVNAAPRSMPFSQITADLWAIFATLPVSVVVRTDTDIIARPAIRSAIRAVDPEQPVTGPRPGPGWSPRRWPGSVSGCCCSSASAGSPGCSRRSASTASWRTR
jgi:putative ABC transport system permease protein